MSISIQAKNQKDELIRLSITESDLVINDEEHIKLEYIYNVQDQDNIIRIDTILQEPATEQNSNKPKTLANVRPKDLVWALKQLIYQALDDSSEFVSQLINLTLPRRSQFPHTKIYCILNPTSGQRLAESQWKNLVQPMLVTAGYAPENLVKINTEQNGKTRQIAKSIGEDILKQNAAFPPIVISMGGDGTLHEVINGLSEAVQLGSGHFRLGVLPSGSGNAFSLGLNIESVEQGVLKIIQAKQEQSFYFMDIKLGRPNASEAWHEQIDYVDEPPIRLLVVFSWGFHAQIVSKSRYLRYFMGNIRFSIVAKFLLTFLQQYQGDLVLKDARKYNHEQEAFDEPRTISLGQEKKFTYFIVSKQHSLEKGFRIAPFASALTEDMDVVMLRDATAESLISASMGAFQGGAHVKSDNVEYFKTQEVYLRVKDKAELCLDGEIHDVPANGIIQLKVLKSSTEQSAFTIFT